MKRLNRFLAPLALTVSGFVLGVFWGSISPFVQPLFSSLSSILSQFESYLQTHPADSGLIFALVGAFARPAMKLSSRFVAYLNHDSTVIDLLFENERDVHVVISHMRQTSFQSLEHCIFRIHALS